MAKQRFSNRNQRLGMKPPVEQQGKWADLGRDFQQAVRQQWVPEQPLQVRCAVQEQTLLVLVEHLLHVEPTPEETFDCLEQTIRQVALDGQAIQTKPEVLGVNKLPVQLFLRIAGYQQPYASRQFEIDLKPPAKPVIPVPSLSPTSPSSEPLTAPSVAVSIAPVSELLPEPAETAAPEVEAPAAETPELAAAAVPELSVSESAAIAEPVLDLQSAELPTIAATSAVVDSETTEATVPGPEHLPAPVADQPDGLLTPPVLEPPVAEFALPEVGQPELEAVPEGLSAPETLPEPASFELLQTEQTEEFAGAEVESQVEVEQPEAIQIAEPFPQAEVVEPGLEPLESLPGEDAEQLPQSELVEALPAESVEPVPEFTRPIASSEPASFVESAEAEFPEPKSGSELLPADWQTEPPEPALDSDRFLPEDLSEPVSETAPVVEHQPQAEWLKPAAPEAEIISVEPLSAAPAPPMTAELDPTVLDEDPSNTPIESEWVASESAMVQSVDAISVEAILEIPEQRIVIPTDSDAVEATSDSGLSIAELLPAVASAELAPAVPPDTDLDPVSPIEPPTVSELAPAEPSLDRELAEPLLADTWVATQSTESQASPIVPAASVEAASVTAVDSPIVSQETEAESRLQPFNESRSDSGAPEADGFNESDVVNQDTALKAPVPTEEPIVDFESVDPISLPLKADSVSEVSVLPGETVALNRPATGLPSAELPEQPAPVDELTSAHETTPLVASQTAGSDASLPQTSPLLPQMSDVRETAKPVASSSTPYVEAQKPTRRFRWSASTLTLAGGIGGFLIASGFYMLSRPCVLGRCEPLQRAEQLGQEAIQTAQTTDSSLAVVEAYGKLNEASYLLGTIPAWSGYHPAAQSLLNRYEDQSVVLGQVVKALEQANTAAQRSQNPPHPLQEWREIQWQWREVISQLEKIPPNHSLYGLVQRKLTEYRANLTDIDQRVSIEQQAQNRVTAARQLEQAAEDRIKAAKTPANWQETATIWTKAIEQLRQIPQGTMPYDEAQQLLAIYQPKLAEANSKRVQEQSGADAYNQALNAAQQAKAMEQQNQWTQAVTYWQEALSSAQQVPSNTSYYNQIQPLVNTYTQSLQQAQQNAQRAVALQTIKPTLDRACNGSPQPCTYTLSPQAIRVQFTALYDKTVSALITKTPATESDLPAAIVNQVNETLRNLATVGDATQVPIELYNSGGTKLGTYTPEFSGYVPQS